MTNFTSVWSHVTRYASHSKTIVTLDRRITNRIVQSSNIEIVVVSEASRTGHERHLRRGDFQLAWDRLVLRKSIGLDDIDPELRGKRAIIFAFLSKVPGVKYTLRPLTIHLVR